MSRAQREPVVLFLGLETFGRLGGIQRFNQRLLRAASRLYGAERFSALLSRDKPEQVPDELSTVVQAMGGNRAGYIGEALRRGRKADVVLLGHVNLLPVGVLVKLLCPKVRLVLLVHGIEVWNDPVFRKRPMYEPALARFATRIAAVSRYTANVMGREYGLPATRFTIFPNTVDAEIAQTHVAHVPPYLLSVSRMDGHDRTKHLDQVIRAMALLPTELAEARLEIVGDGVLRKDLEALAESEGVSERIHFNGRVDEARLDALYSGASAFVLPSTKEGFGIVYLEAWQRLLPVICATAGGAPEVVSDGLDGFAVDPLDVQALAKRMERLLSDPELAARMGGAGAEKLRANYSTAVLEHNLSALVRTAVA